MRAAIRDETSRYRQVYAISSVCAHLFICSQVGGLNGVIGVDCWEEYSVANDGVDRDTVRQYKTDVLPILAHYDDFGKLTVVSFVLFLMHIN